MKICVFRYGTGTFRNNYFCLPYVLQYYCSGLKFLGKAKYLNFN